MNPRILLAALLATMLAACVIVTEPGPATPEPAPAADPAANPAAPEPAPAALSPSKGSPDPDPAALSPSKGSPAPVDEWKKCHDAEDCVPVGCTCSCSGCGGFSSEDIINKDHEDAWYQKKGCEPAKVCPQVCCPQMTVVCEDGQCGVVAGKKVNVH